MIIYIVFAVAGLAAVSVYASNKDKDKKQGVSQNGLSINVSPSTKSSAQSSTQSSSSSPQSDSQSTLKSQSFLQQPNNELNKLIREKQNQTIQENNDSSKITENADDFIRKLNNILNLGGNGINNGGGSDVSGEGGDGEEPSKKIKYASSSCGSCPGEFAESCNTASTSSLEASKKPEDCGPCPEPDDCAESCNSASTTSLEASNKPEDCGPCPEPDDCADNCSDAASMVYSEQFSDLSNDSVVQPMSPEQIDKAAEHIYIIQNRELQNEVIKKYGDKQNGILDKINEYKNKKTNNPTLYSLFTNKIQNIDHVIHFLIELVYLGTFKEYVMVLYPLLFTEKYEVHANTTTNETNPNFELLIINAYRYKYWYETNRNSNSNRNNLSMTKSKINYHLN
jgi:hypothetical protein